MQVIINHALIKLSTFRIDARKQIGIDALVHTPSILKKKKPILNLNLNIAYV